jgi:hypothetical protein
MNPALIDPTIFFQFEVQIESTTLRPNDTDWELPASTKIPDFGQLSGKKPFGELRLAWSEQGLFCQLDVSGKKLPTQFTNAVGGRSDGMRLWLDTRGSPDIHRASRFCQCFNLLPGAQQSSKNSAIATFEPISRARELPNPVRPEQIPIRVAFRKNGYRLNAVLPASVLTGYSPSEYSEMSFFYSVVDEELGVQTLTVGSEMRYYEDPSLWARLRLR